MDTLGQLQIYLCLKRADLLTYYDKRTACKILRENTIPFMF